jgi:hypothetical protein
MPPKRASYKLSDKLSVLMIHDEHPEWSQQAIADEFNRANGTDMKRNTVSDILGKRKELLQQAADSQAGSTKRHRGPQLPELEGALLRWFKQVRFFPLMILQNALTLSFNGCAYLKGCIQYV